MTSRHDSRRDGSSFPPRWKRAMGLTSIVITVLCLVALSRLFPVGTLLAPLTDWIERLGGWGLALFTLIYAGATVLFVPGSALTLASGALFGLWWGTLAVSLGSTLGAAAAFLIARYLARSAVERKLADHPKFRAIDQAVRDGGWKIVVLLRISPMVPFNLQNYLYGLTSIRFWQCVLASWVAMLPGTFLYVYLGYAGRAGVAAAGGAGGGRGMVEWMMLAAGLLATAAVTVYVSRLAGRAIRRESPAGSDSAPREFAAAPPASAPRTLADCAADSEQSREPAMVLGMETRQSEAAKELPPPLLPMDEFNRTLRSHVHPAHWRNPDPRGRYNLVVIGAGTAGLVVAAGAAGLGAKVALIERGLMGGDCLNVGCVPSKALLRCARALADARCATSYGVRLGGPATVDFSGVMRRMRRLRSEIAPHDSAERFRKLGVDVYLGQARFESDGRISVDGRMLEYARAVVATGARAAEVPIPGLEQAGYLTNETVFSLTELPERLAVLGAGPIGCELAQAFARFGSKVTLIEAESQLLTREDRDAAAYVEAALERDGVEIVCGGKASQVLTSSRDKIIALDCKGQRRIISCDAILVSAGRVPNVEGMNLEAVGVKYGRSGVKVDDRLRTSNRRIFAAGDVCSRYQFTHAADALARIVIQNALFFGRAKTSALTIPWCTFTDPEIAHVGITADEARRRGIFLKTVAIDLSEVDRARLDGEAEGILKLHLQSGSDRILGATLVARHAGETISEITLAMVGGVGLNTVAKTIHPYPTQSEVIKKAADAYSRTRVTPRIKRLSTRIMEWRR